MHAEPSPSLSLHFSLGRIPVVVEPSFWFITLLFGALSGYTWDLVLTWVVVCFVSFLVHEVGHALAALSFGSDVAVRLFSFGGACYHRVAGRWRNVGVSAAGPLAGFLFFGLLLAVQHVSPPQSLRAAHAFRMLEFVNLYWGLINLIPVLPLDGGAVAHGVLGPARQRLAFGLGGVASSGAALFFLLSGWLLPGVMFGLFGLRSFQALRQARDIRPQKPPPPEPDALPRGWAALRAGDEREAERLARLALSASAPGPDANAARDLLAWVALAASEPRAALAHLEKVDPPGAVRPFTQALAFEAAGLPERALAPALAALQKEPAEPVAALALRLLVAAGRLEEAERLGRDFAWSRPATRDARLADVAAARGEHGSAALLYASAFEAGGAGEHAFRAAAGHARAGQLERAAEWLQRALAAGFDDGEALAAEPALAPVRAAAATPAQAPGAQRD